MSSYTHACYAFVVLRFIDMQPHNYSIVNNCKNKTSAAKTMTMIPTILMALFAQISPTAVKSIDPNVDARTVNDIDEVLLRNVGK